MNNIQITADSTCDLSPAQIKENNILIAPLYINKGDESFKDLIEINTEDVFEYFDQTGNLTKTSAVPVGDYIDLFEPIVKSGKKVLHINLGSKVSTCYQNALAAASNFEEGSVYVIDSNNLSTGMGITVLRACEMAKEGIPIEEIAKTLTDDFVPNIETSFVVDTLVYIHKGGRCSTVAKLGANLLKLKPSIEVKDGTMKVVKKYRGSFEKTVLQFITERLSNRDDIDKRKIFVTHSPCSKEVLDSVKKLVAELVDFEEIIDTDAGCVISNHCGPNALGIIFARK